MRARWRAGWRVDAASGARPVGALAGAPGWLARPLARWLASRRCLWCASRWRAGWRVDAADHDAASGAWFSIRSGCASCVSCECPHDEWMATGMPLAVPASAHLPLASAHLPLAVPALVPESWARRGRGPGTFLFLAGTSRFVAGTFSFFGWDLFIFGWDL